MNEPIIEDLIPFGNRQAFPTYKDKIYIPKDRYELAEETEDFIILKPV